MKAHRELIDRLARHGIECRLVRDRRHRLLEVTDGEHTAVMTVAATPSDRRHIANAAATARRLLRTAHPNRVRD